MSSISIREDGVLNAKFYGPGNSDPAPITNGVGPTNRPDECSNRQQQQAAVSTWEDEGGTTVAPARKDSAEGCAPETGVLFTYQPANSNKWKFRGR